MTQACTNGIVCEGSWRGIAPQFMASVRIWASIWVMRPAGACSRLAATRETESASGPVEGKW